MFNQDIFREKPFREMRLFLIIWSGQVVSMLGSGLTAFALGVWVYQRNESITQFALILLLRTIPFIILSPVAGSLVDRMDKRLMMIAGDTGAAIGSLFIAMMFLSGNLHIWHIYLAVATGAIAESFQLPASLTAITLLVPEKHYARASGLGQLAQGIAEVMAPLLAGFLMVSTGMAGVLLIDFITFLFAITVLLWVRFPATATDGSPPEQAEKATWRTDLTFGIRYIFNHSGLFGLLIFFAIVAFQGGTIGVLVQPMVLAFTSPDKLGIILTVAGCGLLTGSLWLSIKGRRRRQIESVLGFLALFGLCITLMGLRPSVGLIAISAAGAHFSMPFINGCNQAIWQTQVPLPIQGRVFAARQMATHTTRLLALIFIGPLADYVFNPLLTADGLLANSMGNIIGTGPGRGAAFIFTLTGIAILITAAIGYLTPSIRTIEDSSSPGETEFIFSHNH